jgi:hypothetical protein
VGMKERIVWGMKEPVDKRMKGDPLGWG